MWTILANAKLDDVFRSTQENFKESPNGNRMLGVLLGAIAIVILLVLFSHKRQRTLAPRTLNHPGKLLREVVKQLPIRPAELKQLKLLAARQNCSSPLVLLLCPSLLAKGLKASIAKSERKVLGHVARKVGM